MVFRQWLYEAGYPEYEVDWTYNQRNRSVQLKIKQNQSGTIFKMPVNIRMDDVVHTVWIEEKEVVHEIVVSVKPS